MTLYYVETPPSAINPALVAFAEFVLATTMHSIRLAVPRPAIKWMQRADAATAAAWPGRVYECDTPKLGVAFSDDLTSIWLRADLSPGHLVTVVPHEVWHVAQFAELGANLNSANLADLEPDAHEAGRIVAAVLRR